MYQWNGKTLNAYNKLFSRIEFVDWIEIVNNRSVYI